ncbi:MAG: pyridoxamine 5'-phosphate oxidase family protein [Clostridia bacterium]|jgi:general stress protein 26
MKERIPLEALRSLVGDVHVGLFISQGPDAYPDSRWMTVTLLEREHNCLYSVSIAGTRKIQEIEAGDKVAWSFQSPSLDCIVSVRGRAAVLDNPRLKAEVLEHLGSRLENFWKINPDPGKLVVIETYIERATLYLPGENFMVSQEVGS